MYGAKIAAVGVYLPPEIVTNETLAAEMRERAEGLIENRVFAADDPRLTALRSDPEWLVKTTGIRERRRADPTQATSDLAALALGDALRRAGWQARDLDLIIAATVTPDHPASPPTGALIQAKLDGVGSRRRQDCQNEICIGDLGAACSSFITALVLAYGQVRAGLAWRAAVVGADVMSRLANPNNRAIYPLMGDGAGAFLLERVGAEEDRFARERFFFGADGSEGSLIIVPAGGSRRPILEEDETVLFDPLDPSATLQMNGRAVFKLVVKLISQKIIPAALTKAGLRLDEIDVLVFHQANLRIIQAVVDHLEYRGVVPTNIEKVGNASSASIPLCFAEALDVGLIRPKQKIMLVAFGGGLTWATTILRL